MGISYTRQDNLPWRGGLPRYIQGPDLMLPRSTSLMFPWNRWDLDTTEIFGGIEQKIGRDWIVKLNLTRNRQQSAQKIGYVIGAVNNPGTGTTQNAGPLLGATYNDFSSDQLSPRRP